MRHPWRAMLPAVILTLVPAPSGSGEAPPHLGAALSEQRNLSRDRPNDAGVWNDLGNLLVLRGDLDQAESAYDRALQIEPARIGTRFNLALLRQQRGDLDGAIADYRTLLESDPGNAWAQYQLGAAYEAHGQRPLALERYAEAFTLDPELLFAENNPHIIENRLVTEALLQARRGHRSRPPAPRAYDEPGRIGSILIPGPVPPPSDASAAEGLDGDDGDDGAAPRPAHEPSPVPAQQSLSLRRAPEAADAANLSAPKARVLDSRDLRGGARNQVSGDAEPAVPASPSARRRASANVTPPPGRRPSLRQSPASDGSGAFGVGQRSTGSLDWRLGGPASDQPVPAR